MTRLILRQKREKFNEAISLLSDAVSVETRALAALHYAKGTKEKEIAEALGCALKSVYRSYPRKELLKEYGYEA